MVSVKMIPAPVLDAGLPEAVAKAHPDMSLGSYPFFSPDGYGSNLVVRSRDADALAGAVSELIAALRGAGIENVREIEVA